MFDQKKNNSIIIKDIKHNGFYKDKDFLITPTGAIMMSMHYDNKILQQQMDYQDRIVTYINQKHQNNIKKQYNPLIVNLYNNGIFIINKEEYNIKDFFIVYSNKDFYLKCTDPKFKNKEIEYNKAVKYIDTTAFINLIKNEKIIVNNNKIIIDNIDILTDNIKNWDGYIHSETKETDAIKNKKMIEGDISER